MNRNPFIFGSPVPPHAFHGRQETVHFILDRLYGASRSSIALWGDQRVGKTSLLYFLTQPKLRQEWVGDPAMHQMIFLDCQSLATVSQPAFWRRVLEQIDHIGEEQIWISHAETMLNENDLSHRKLRRLFRLMQQEGATLTLLLDEFGHITQPGQEEEEREARALLNFLRTLITAVNPLTTNPRPLALVTSTRRPLDEVCRPLYRHRDIGSPFYNPFVYERLGPFSLDSVESLLNTKLAKTKIDFTQREKIKLIQIAGRHPALVQSYASELFMTKHRTGGQEITDFSELDKEFYDRSQQYFSDLWDYSGRVEQEFLRTFMTGQLDLTDLVPSQEKARRQLLERGLLERSPKGFKLFSPMLYQWLRLNLPTRDTLRGRGFTYQLDLGIPPTLFVRLRTTLLDCFPANDEQAILTLFVDGRLAPWRHLIPEADTPHKRIENLVATLYNQYNDEDNALLLLLQVMQDRLDPADACHTQLGDLVEAVKDVFA